jgi:hypothetical protein
VAVVCSLNRCNRGFGFTLEDQGAQNAADHEHIAEALLRINDAIFGNGTPGVKSVSEYILLSGMEHTTVRAGSFVYDGRYRRGYHPANNRK